MFLIHAADRYINEDLVRSNISFQECFAILRSLEVYRWPSGYQNLGTIEIEKRKRYLCLSYFFNFVRHLRHRDDQFPLFSAGEQLVIDPSVLLHIEVDDEFISNGKVVFSPSLSFIIIKSVLHNSHCSQLFVSKRMISKISASDSICGHSSFDCVSFECDNPT